MPIPSKMKSHIIKNLNWSLIFSMTGLIIIGLINLYSTSYNAQTEGGNLFYTQLSWIGLGLAGFVILSFIDYHFFTQTAYILYILNILCLMATAVFGNTYGGSQRWLDLGLFNYQPAETTKIVLIFVLARILSIKRSWRFMTLTELLKPAVLIVIPIFFIVKQPDLGTALITLIIAGSIIIFAKVDKNILLVSFGLLLFTAPVLWSFGLKEYQKNRIRTFISPDQDPTGTGYNIIQSKIAIGSGQLTGKGFQKGTQSQLEFLPERSTDFIFSVLSEEHGFIGSFITIALLLFLIWTGFSIGFQARDKPGVFLCVGMSFYLFWYVFINIGMTMGILPVVGIPLPLISYGGSSFMTTMTALGVISSVALRKNLF